MNKVGLSLTCVVAHVFSFSSSSTLSTPVSGSLGGLAELE